MEQSLVKRDFRRYSSQHENAKAIQKKVAQHLCAMLPAMQSPKILEIGCGTGNLTPLLFNKYPDATFDITDSSPKMLKECSLKHKHPNAKYFMADGEDINRHQQYDLIVSSLVFPWFDTPLASLEKLTQQGNVYFSAFGATHFKEWKEIAKKNKLDNKTLPTVNWPNVMHENIFKESYASGLAFLQSLKEVGESTPNEAFDKVHYKKFKKSLDEYNEDSTWHIIYAHKEKSR